MFKPKFVNKNIFFGLLASIFGFFLIYCTTNNYGLGLTSDSAGYIGVARNLISGNGFINFNGEYFVYQPPLYSIVLALASKVITADPLTISRLINAIFNSISIYLVYYILRFQFIKKDIFTVIGTLIALFSIVHYKISVMVLSEPLFILISLAIIILSFKLFNNYNYRTLICLSIFISLLTLTKYIGVIYIFWGILIIRRFCINNLRSLFFHIATFSSISALPISIWLVRNYLLTETFTGPRASHGFDVFPKLLELFSTLTSWLIHPKIFQSSEYLFVGFLMSIIIALLIAMRINEIKISYEFKYLSLLIFFYSSFLLYSSTKLDLVVGNRLLSPIYIPVVLLLLNLSDTAISNLLDKCSLKLKNIIFLSVTILWLVYPTREIYRFAHKITEQGIGYAGEIWQNNDVVKFINDNKTVFEDSALYTNEPYASYMLTGLSAVSSPHKSNKIEDFFKSKTDKKNYLIWYNSIDQNVYHSVDSINTIIDIEPIFDSNDGNIYKIF